MTGKVASIAEGAVLDLLFITLTHGQYLQRASLHCHEYNSPSAPLCLSLCLSVSLYVCLSVER